MLRMQLIDLGEIRFRIPVAEIIGKRPGKILLVTAGMDGDEYAGMQAAYRLIEKYSDRNFAGKLIVIPIVNMLGFLDECSQNPIDSKFPKNVWPGRIDGKSTEQLVHWLNTNFVSQANLWFDCHGGAITEGLQPFLWVWRTKSTNEFIDEFLSKISAEVIIDEQTLAGSKPYHLAKYNCPYILSESGSRGKSEEVDIIRHLDWIRGAMLTMEMIEGSMFSQSDEGFETNIYHQVHYYFAPYDGLWEPVISLNNLIKRGEIIGSFIKFDQTGKNTIKHKKSGTRLWWKETMALRKGDVVCAVGH